MAIPIASHAPPVPKATATAIPIPAPSAIPNPICIDGRLISTPLFSSSNIRMVAPPCSRFLREGGDLALLLRAAICWRQNLRLRRFVADRADLAQQFIHAHAGERLEQRRDLRRHLGEVAGDLVHPGSIAVSG